MICSGEKTKFLIIDTEQKKRQNTNRDIKIMLNLCGKEITGSKSEKLIDVIVSNTATWKHMLYGNDTELGLKAIKEGWHA